MINDITRRIEKGLLEKRQNAAHWLAGASAEEKQTCLCEDEACLDTHLQAIDSALEKAAEGTLGLCTVCHGYVDDQLLEMDYTSSVCLDHFSPEERRRLESELELSQIVQRALLPQQIPSVPGLELAAFSRPSDILGGDYFDFLHFRNGAFAMAIADIVGHGVSAGMLMSSLQTALRTLVPLHDSAADVLGQINHFYLHNIHLTTFITAFLASFDQSTRMLTYSNAGQTSPIVIQGKSRQVAWLKPTNPALGLAEDYVPQTASIQLSPGDLLLLYTDGITEAMNRHGDQFGMERLAVLAAKNAELPAQQLVAAVRQGVYEFADGQPLEDDTTIAAGKVS
jgi:phosphoserine phosphatase RsbU/P